MQEGKEMCIFVELPATSPPTNISLSVSCYAPLP
jgi:hypothetical protein